MRTSIFLRILFTVLLGLLYVKGLGYAFYAMNLNSDLFAVSGVVGGLVSTFVLYKILKLTWR